MIPIVLLFTACWYYTSSSNAVASQRLFKEFRNLNTNDDAPVTLSPPTLTQVAITLTTLQLFTGSLLAILFWTFYSICGGKQTIFNNSDGSNNNNNNNSNSNSFTISKSQIAVGCFHSFGSLLTNLGFAFGGASLVQVVKLLEPIETILLVATVNMIMYKMPFHISLETLGAILMVVLGTSLLMASDGLSSAVNINSVACAFVSGVCMSSRNVVESKLNSKKAVKHHGESDVEATPLVTAVFSSFTKGFVSFTRLTLLATCVLTVATIPTILSGYLPISTVKQIVSNPSSNAIDAILYFSCYQIASIVVLSLTSAPTHSLLNVGKRISNVIYAAYVFSDPLGTVGVIGLCIAFFGGILYSNSKKKKSIGGCVQLEGIKRIFTCRRSIVFPCVGVVMLYMGNVISSTSMTSLMLTQQYQSVVDKRVTMNILHSNNDTLGR
jgi:hypothetical protein